MVLNNRAPKLNTHSNSNTSFPQPNNVANNSNKEVRLRRYFQTRGVFCLGIVVFILFLFGSNSSTSNFNDNATTSTNIKPSKERDISFVQTSYKHKAEVSSTYTTKFETEHDSFSTKDSELTNALSSPNAPTCSKPRSYPDLKYYQLYSDVSKQPSFLTTDAQYIRGKAPFILHPTTKKKICVDSSSWDTPTGNRLPFSDGQNPSIMSLSTQPDPLMKEIEFDGANKKDDDYTRLSNIRSIEAILELVGGIQAVQEMFAGVVYVGGAQCGYGMSNDEREEYHISTLDKPPIEQALFLVLDKKMDNVIQSTILLERDLEQWGKVKFKGSKLNDRMVEKLDDPRLFFYEGELWVLFRNGRAFGFDKQIHNKLHFELEHGKASSDEKKLVVYIKASETVTTCCGRNMAMVSNPTNSVLKTVTWVDPMTVQDALQDSSSTARKLAKQRKSDIHGTNGYMVPLYNSDEYLGIAHFHRPEDRDTSPYALHGHHYTHAFFTMSMNEPHKLTRISNEFLFEALHPTVDGKDGEVIQFASGIDIVERTQHSTNGEKIVRNELMVSYGVNDCESAAATFDLDHLNELLLDADGAEVIDLMQTRSDL